MADGGNGLEGSIAVVQRTRGYRKWPEEVARLPGPAEPVDEHSRWPRR